jgi:hypothetical protein
MAPPSALHILEAHETTPFYFAGPPDADRDRGRLGNRQYRSVRTVDLFAGVVVVTWQQQHQ